MPSSTTSVSPSSRAPRTNSRIAGRSSSSLSAIVSQPSRSSSSGVPDGAHSVPSLRQIRRTTSSSAARREPLGDRLLELRREVGLERRRAAGHDRLALGLDAADQLVHRHDERVDALAQQLVGHVAQVDAGGAQRLEVGGRVLGGGGARDVALAGGRLQRRERHRVDRVGADQPVDVERVGVGRVLDAGRRPQRALHRAAGGAQRGELVAVEDAPERLVGGARVGEPRAPLEVLAPERGEPLVDLGVDARDEERGDRVAVERQAVGVPALHRADVRAHHVLVGGDAEQQRDVDVHPLVQRRLDRRDARRRRRDLDHQVGPVDEPPVEPRLLDRPLRVVRQPRRDLERDVAVVAAGVVVDAAQHVGGELDVADREAAVDLARGQALVGRLGHVLVVVGRAEDRLLEDRRVRRDAAQRVLLDHPGELAALDHAAPDLVEPDARAGGRQRREALVHDGAHVLGSSRARPARARRSPRR